MGTLPVPRGNLLSLLTLSRGAAPNAFVAGARGGRARTFGGELLGRAAFAAQSTVGPAMRLHALHGHFIAAGSDALQTTYVVDAVRDGRVSAVRQVWAVQEDVVCFIATVSFASACDKPAYQPPPPNVPGPETLPTVEVLRLLYGERSPELFDRWLRRAALFDFRPVDVGQFIMPNPDVWERQFWIRFKDVAAVSDGRDAQLLAYASDHSLIDGTMMPFGRITADGAARTTSLTRISHAVRRIGA